MNFPLQHIFNQIQLQLACSAETKKFAEFVLVQKVAVTICNVLGHSKVWMYLLG